MSDIQDTAPKKTKALPDWWQREKQRRQNWVLIFLLLLLVLIGYWYWVNSFGLIGKTAGVTFETDKYITFVHTDTKGVPTLYAVRADGTDMRVLSQDTDKSNKQDPAWTNDGKNLIYASNNNSNQVMQLYIMGSGAPKQMTYGAGNKFAPVPSPDGKRVAFLTQGGVKTVLTNGEDVVQIMPPPRSSNSGGNEEEAARMGDLRGPYLWTGFSADGEQLAAVQSLNSEENPANLGDFVPGDQVLRVLLNGKNEFLDTGRDVSACWEPTGKRLVSAFSEFHLPAKEKTGILKTAEFVSGVRVWTFDNGKPTPKPVLIAVDYTIEPRNISWSPDGNYIAVEFWRHKKGGEKTLLGIGVLDLSKNASSSILTEKQADELSKSMLIPATEDGKPMRPRWSPDGSRLMYELIHPGGGRDICVVNSDNTNQITLTRDLGGDNSQAAWAPTKK
jgi:dipeptidyl aminopeptidase/acylaminoacyl peptidase